MDGLTAIQEKYLRVIANFLEQNGRAPTRRELASLTGQKSVNGVRQHLTALQKKAYIKLDPPGRIRNIQILRMPIRQLTLFDY